ncbi:LacI family transcriptional regulator [Candidatus Acetothermia bacterium]|nr:MAG: LacI family transcriptional regulator [Candidatus Acetothermia bacterium]
MAVTIRDVAKRAGVSPSTASRALNGKGRMRPETRARILRAAQELGYRPNVHARGLATRVTGCVGVVIAARHLPVERSFYGLVLEAIESTLDEEGYHVVFSVLRDQSPPKCAQEGRVDGLTILGTDIGPELVLPLREELPVVLVDNAVPGVDSLLPDNESGARAAVEHLISHGHREIAFIAETLADPSVARRLAGYRAALEAYGIPFREELVAEGGRRPQSWRGAMERLFSLKKFPSAIFAANDSMAIGAMRVLQERGIPVPEGVAVVGFDDGDLAPYVTPPLTSVFVPRWELGEAAARRLLELIRGEEPRARQVVLATELVVRRSCGCTHPGPGSASAG